MQTKFISFYADIPGTDYYTRHAKMLKARFAELDAAYHIEELPSKNHFALNCLMKPQFILDCLRKFDAPLIWIDVDCTINKLPKQLDRVKADVACACREDGTPHSALLYFNNTEKSVLFLEEWIAKCAAITNEAAKSKPHKRGGTGIPGTGGDHHHLIVTMLENKHNVKVRKFTSKLCSVDSPDAYVNIGLSRNDNNK